MDGVLLTPISFYGETAYMWSDNIALYALLGFVAFYVLSIVLIGPIIGEPALFVSVFVSLIFMMLVQLGIERKYDVFDNQDQAKAFIASKIRVAKEPSPDNASNSQSDQSTANTLTTNLSTESGIEKSLNVLPDQFISRSDVEKLKNTKNINALKAIVRAYEFGSKDILVDKEKSDLWANKLINIAIDSRQDLMLLLSQYEDHLTKKQISSYLQKIELDCHTAKGVYESTSTIREIGVPMVDEYAKSNCVSVRNNYLDFKEQYGLSI